MRKVTPQRSRKQASLQVRKQSDRHLLREKRMLHLDRLASLQFGQNLLSAVGVEHHASPRPLVEVRWPYLFAIHQSQAEPIQDDRAELFDQVERQRRTPRA